MTPEDLWRTEAGAIVFNAITRCNLQDREGFPMLFSRRLELTKHVLGLMLEAGYIPEDTTPRVGEGSG